MMPTAKDGKICYIEMPTKDAQTSADFYQRVFGWTIRTRGDGAIAFDDTTGEVSGAFVKGRPPAATPGLMVYIMVDSVADAIEKGEGQWRRDCAADRRRSGGDDGSVSRSGWECDWALSGAGVKLLRVCGISSLVAGTYELD